MGNAKALCKTKERMIQMMKEMKIEVRKEGAAECIRYYMDLTDPKVSEFDCVMYTVGIEDGKVSEKIYDFSPDRDEAERLLEYLYKNNVTADRLFSAAEEFITAG